MKKENQKIVTMSFRLSQDLRDRIDKLAEVTKDSPSETVRYAVELYLNEKGI